MINRVPKSHLDGRSVGRSVEVIHKLSYDWRSQSEGPHKSVRSAMAEAMAKVVGIGMPTAFATAIASSMATAVLLQKFCLRLIKNMRKERKGERL